MTKSSIDRKLERVAREIAEAEAKAKPMTEEQFERGDHQVDGGVIETPEPNYNYGIFARQTLVDAILHVWNDPESEQDSAEEYADAVADLFVRRMAEKRIIWTPLANLVNFR